MEDTIEKFTNLPAPVILALAFYVFGLLLRMIKIFPNRFIPLVICLASAVIYPLITSDERVGFTYTNVKPMMYIQGFMIGAIAVAANEILRNIPVVGPFLDKVQNAFKRVGLNGSGNTMELTQEQVKEELKKANENTINSPTNPPDSKP